MASEIISLVGLDWGSSHLRAYAFDANGDVVDKRTSAAGAMTLQSPQAFHQALFDLVDHDLRWRSAPRIACGMVGARGAWVEAGYCPIGADSALLAEKLIAIEITDAKPLWVIPGVASPVPDVMRGEETQLVGADIANGTVILPGTHSKWAKLNDGTIASFRTYLTGEMNALIRNHSTIGRILSATAQANDVAVERGIAMARSRQSWLTTLFSFRARAVAQGVDPQTLSDELSAWLIATEFVDALSGQSKLSEVSVVGSEHLAEWYAAVATRLGIRVHRLDADRCVTTGLWRIARAKSLA